jgi:hypothetical protein
MVPDRGLFVLLWVCLAIYGSWISRGLPLALLGPSLAIAVEGSWLPLWFAAPVGVMSFTCPLVHEFHLPVCGSDGSDEFMLSVFGRGTSVGLWLAAVITGTDVTQGPRVIPAVHLPE